MSEPRILIAGAGIAGLALARALTAQGTPFDLVEREAAHQATGTGLYLPANAVRALHRLGLGDGLARQAHRITRQRLCDHRGARLSEFDVNVVWGETGDCCAVSRVALHEMLRAGVGPAAVRTGAGVADADPDGNVTFQDGSTTRYDLVVGADGVHSTVRRRVFGGAEPRFLRQVCWRFVATGLPDLARSPDWTARLGGDGRTFLTVPLGGDRVYCYAEAGSAEPTAPPGDWRALFADFADPVPRLLEQGERAHFAPLTEIAGTDWTRGHVLLIGDAAHACSPSMAQGGAMALEDALVLADVLKEARDGGGPDVGEVLAAYTARRGGRVQWVLDQNHRRDRTRTLPVPVRNLVLRLAGARIFRANHTLLREEP